MLNRFFNNRSLRDRLKADIAELKGAHPKLSLLQVGNRSDSTSYIRLKEKAAAEVSCGHTGSKIFTMVALLSDPICRTTLLGWHWVCASPVSWNSYSGWATRTDTSTEPWRISWRHFGSVTSTRAHTWIRYHWSYKTVKRCWWVSQENVYTDRAHT